MEVEEVLAEGQVLVDNPPKDPGEALLALTFCYYDHSLNYLTKGMWRRAMALSIEAPDTPNGKRYAALDAKLAQQVGDLLRRFQDNGTLAPNLEATALGRVLFNNLNQSFISFVTDDDMTLDDLRDDVTALTKPITQLLPRLTS